MIGITTLVTSSTKLTAQCCPVAPDFLGSAMNIDFKTASIVVEFITRCYLVYILLTNSFNFFYGDVIWPLDLTFLHAFIATFTFAFNIACTSQYSLVSTSDLLSYNSFTYLACVSSSCLLQSLSP